MNGISQFGKDGRTVFLTVSIVGGKVNFSLHVISRNRQLSHEYGDDFEIFSI